MLLLLDTNSAVARARKSQQRPQHEMKGGQRHTGQRATCLIRLLLLLWTIAMLKKTTHIVGPLSALALCLEEETTDGLWQDGLLHAQEGTQAQEHMPRNTCSNQ